ncbi:MAG: hypothetical protein AAB884_00690 [Patescibacteria group bacterium]
MFEGVRKFFKPETPEEEKPSFDEGSLTSLTGKLYQLIAKREKITLDPSLGGERRYNALVDLNRGIDVLNQRIAKLVAKKKQK